MHFCYRLWSMSNVLQLQRELRLDPSVLPTLVLQHGQFDTTSGLLGRMDQNIIKKVEVRFIHWRLMIGF